MPQQQPPQSPPLQHQDSQDSQDEAASGPLSPGAENAAATLLLPGIRLRGPQPPPVNPLKFIKVTPPVNLYKPPPVRELPPPIEKKKEDAEDWQNHLEGWKSNRRKRQEQLMERVTEIKKSEEEGQFNSSSRRNKTFSEMMKARKSSILVYNDGDENDFSDLGLGTKSQSEENSSDEVFQTSENEFTYEKAIQNYVEYASSRGNKPSASNGPEAPTTDVVKVASVSIKDKEDVISDQNSQPKVVEKKEEKTPKFKRPPPLKSDDNVPNETRSSLAEKIYLFENAESLNNSSTKNQTENKTEVNLTPTKKTAPPVPAKPQKPTQKEEPSNVILQQQEITVEITEKENNQWSQVDSSNKRETENIEPTLIIQETDELVICSSSPAASDSSSSVQQTIQSNEHQPSDDCSSNPEIEFFPAASATEVHSVCSPNLKLIEAASLEHVPPRDIQRSPLSGDDSGVHTADSVSQSDEVEDDEELPSQTDDGINGLLGILSSQVPIIDHELSALLAPPSRLEPPKEKPPPPPPVSVEPDTESMRKSFLGLEVNSKPILPSSEAPTLPDSSDSDCLGNQLKERLLKLEEEKNNMINMEKQLKAEKPPSLGTTVIANNDSADSHQERLALEREALKIERDAIASRKQTSFAKKLAVKSLESLDIPPIQDILITKEENNYYALEQSSVPANNESKPTEVTCHTNNDTSYIFQQMESSNMPQYYHGYEHPDQKQCIAMAATENNNYSTSPTVCTEQHVVEFESNHQSLQKQYHTSPKQNNIRTENTQICERFQQYQSQIQQNNNYQQHKQQPKQIKQQHQHQQKIYQQKKHSSPASEQYYVPPTPWYGEHNVTSKNYYEDTHVNYYEPQPASDITPLKPTSNDIPHVSQGNWSKQTNYITPAPASRKKGPPPPMKPSRVAQQKIPLTRNYSADSILESLDGDAPVMLRNPKGNAGSNHTGRSSLQYSLGGSMSQLPSNSTAPQPRQRPSSQGVNYQHWLVQEAEHRRITEQQQRQAAANNARQPKHLPDAIIMSLTQRVQQRQSHVSQPQVPSQQQQQPPKQHNNISPPRSAAEDKMLSVSGKKKCSHCNLELGRGAAMIIESLRLFYHIDCFKCCVCCIQLGDGLMGTDVRVRNGKLHCHSCYSSDDGVKFSCV